MGHITAGPPVALAGACGLLFGVTFADLASGATRKTRLVVRLAISCGCCGSSCLIAVGATGGWAAAALGASVAFTVANPGREPKLAPSASLRAAWRGRLESPD